MKTLMTLWILAMTALFSYLIFRLTRSVWITGIVVVIFIGVLIFTLSKEQRKIFKSRFKPINKTGPKRYDIDHLEIESFSDSILVSQRTKSLVTVFLKADAVKNFGQICPEHISNIPVYMACSALKLPILKILKILQSVDSYKIQEIKASEKKETQHWGDEKLYFIQLNANYF